jgi:cytochrome c oxidase subunit II
MKSLNKPMAQLVGLATGGTALLTAATALAEPLGSDTIWSLPRDVSRDGHRIDWLIQVTNGFVILLFGIMCVWMAWAILKHNSDHEAEYDHGDSRHHIAVAMGISALIFFVVDGNLWFNSTIDVNTVYWNFELAEKSPNVVRIEVNAHQWAWDARYAGPDGKFGTKDDFVTLNDVRVPMGLGADSKPNTDDDVPVSMQLASTDVIHSFYLPNLRIKQDAVPGMINRMWFVAAKKGEVEIGCAQHCGVHHYKMKGILTIMEPADFQAWSQHMSEQAQLGYDANDAEGNWGWKWREI